MRGLFLLFLALALAGCDTIRRDVSEVDETVSFNDKGLDNPQLQFKTSVFLRDPALSGLKK